MCERGRRSRKRQAGSARASRVSRPAFAGRTSGAGCRAGQPVTAAQVHAGASSAHRRRARRARGEGGVRRPPVRFGGPHVRRSGALRPGSFRAGRSASPPAELPSRGVSDARTSLRAPSGARASTAASCAGPRTRRREARARPRGRAPSSYHGVPARDRSRLADRSRGVAPRATSSDVGPRRVGN